MVVNGFVLLGDSCSFHPRGSNWGTLLAKLLLLLGGGIAWISRPDNDGLLLPTRAVFHIMTRSGTIGNNKAWLSKAVRFWYLLRMHKFGSSLYTSLFKALVIVLFSYGCLFACLSGSHRRQSIFPGNMAIVTVPSKIENRKRVAPDSAEVMSLNTPLQNLWLVGDFEYRMCSALPGISSLQAHQFVDAAEAPTQNHNWLMTLIPVMFDILDLPGIWSTQFCWRL